MLKVRTRLGLNPIAGVGLFADEFIPSGTLVYEEDNLTIKINVEDFKNYSKQEIDYIQKYGYKRSEIWYLSIDNAKYTNHSDDPNCRDGVDNNTYACRDILPGEEITSDYNEVGSMMPWL